jgi:DNA-binding MarR family transcriptional regulator
MKQLSHTTKSAADPLVCAATLLDSLPAVVWFIRRNMRKHRTAGLSVPQFRTLALVQRFPEAPLSLVAEHLGATLPTASRIMSGLVNKGLVVRRDCSADRRRVSLRLTAKGITTLRVSRAATRRRMAEVLGGAAARDRRLITAASKLLKALFEGDAAAEFPSKQRRGS